MQHLTGGKVTIKQELRGLNVSISCSGGSSMKWGMEMRTRLFWLKIGFSCGLF
jgi:hypothetical protein